MGNLQEKLAQERSVEELSKSLKHYEETRSDFEIEITDRLVHLLSDLNSKRVTEHKSKALLSDLNW